MRNKRELVIATAALIAAAVWLAVVIPRGNTLTVAFLDVGDGLCVVVRSPSGRTLVMDCGTSSLRNSDSIGERVAARYLQSLGVDAIDVAVLSHPHSDHVSGYSGLLQLKPARLVLDAGIRHPSPDYRRFLKALKKSRAKYRIAKRGQVVALDDQTTVHILNPGPSAKHAQLNDDSIVLRIVHKRVGILLAADAARQTEKEIVASGVKLRAQVLQVGHHGSNASSSPEWLKAVRPEVAVISCARDSRYGFPSSETMSRIRSVGAKTYVTGTDGAVIITTDGATIRVHAYRSPNSR